MAERINARAILAFAQAHTFTFAIVLALGLLIANLFVAPGFLTPGSFAATLANLAPFAVVAMATAPSIIVGGLDLSIGPLVSLTNIVMVAVLLPAGLGGPWVSIPILVTLAVVCAAASGAVISYLRIPAVIVGLCALFILGGVGQKILPTALAAPPNWTDQLGGKVGPVPWGLILIAIPLILWYLLKQTPLIRAIFAVGGDQTVAYTTGIQVALVRVAAYGLGGAFAAIAGLALTGLIRSADTSLALQYTLIAIAAVALGGTPIGGGRGGLTGALLGAVCIFLLQILLSNLRVSPSWLNVVYGCVLIGAVVLGGRLIQAGKVRVTN